MRDCSRTWRVDVDQRIAFADDLRFTVVHGGNKTGNLARDHAGVDRRDRANGVQVDADVALLRGNGVDRDRAAEAFLRRLLLCRLRFVVMFAKRKVKDEHQHESDREPDPRARLGSDRPIPAPVSLRVRRI
jgi:hypothetical protein